MPLLDTHCHLDAYADPLAVARAAQAAQVDLVAVTEDPDSFRRFRMRVGKAPGVDVALGMHPGGRAASSPGQLQRFFRMVSHANWIGEVGLDYAHGTDTRDKRAQYSTFSTIVDHDLARALPMTVHSRGAAADTIAVLEGTGVRAILHWFTGTPNQAARAADAGLWFSINSAMVRSTNGAKIVASIPRDRVLLETDGPYCSHRGSPAHPRDLPAIVDDLARLLAMLPNDVRTLIDTNTSKFLGGSPADG